MGPDVKDDELNLKYDRHWLAVLKNTNHLLSVEKKNRLALPFSLLAVLCWKLGCGKKKSSLKNLAIFFLSPSKQFLPISFKIQLLEYYNQCVCLLCNLLPLFPPYLTHFSYRRDWIRSSRKVQLGPAKRKEKNLVWIGEIERKLAKLSVTTFTDRSSA